MEGSRGSSERLRNGKDGGKRHGLIFGRQRDSSQDRCCDSRRSSWVAKSVGSAKVIRSLSQFGKSLNCNLPLSLVPHCRIFPRLSTGSHQPIPGSVALWRSTIRKLRYPTREIRNLSILVQPHPLPCCCCRGKEQETNGFAEATRRPHARSHASAGRSASGVVTVGRTARRCSAMREWLGPRAEVKRRNAIVPAAWRLLGRWVEKTEETPDLCMIVP